MTRVIASRGIIFIVSIAILITGWYFVSANDSENITVCVRRNGAMYLVGDDYMRDECRKKDTLLSWHIKGDKGDPGEKGEKGDLGVNGKDGMELHLFDADSQDLGILLDATGSSDMNYQTYLPDIGVLVASHQNPANMTAVMNLPGKSIQYTNSDCTGQALTTGDMAPQVLYRDDAGEYGLGYIMWTFESPTQRTIKSRREANGNCKDLGSQSVLTNTLKQVVLPFTEPLAWPLKIVGF